MATNTNTEFGSPEKMVEDVMATTDSKMTDSPTEDATEGDSKRITGVVTRWSHRGYGFVRPEDGGEDVFVHLSAIKDGNALAMDSKVEFLKVFDDRKGKFRAEELTGGVEEEERPAAPSSSRPSYGFGSSRPKGVCYDWQSGKCTRGSSCRFSHGDSFSSFSGSRQSNFSGGRPRGVCYDWQKGTCNRGSSCRFAHGADGSASHSGGGGGGNAFSNFGSKPRGVCYDWQSGNCNRGESCRFSHESNGSGGDGYGHGGGYGDRAPAGGFNTGSAPAW